jgi:hypothetical protein
MRTLKFFKCLQTTRRTKGWSLACKTRSKTTCSSSQISSRFKQLFSSSKQLRLSKPSRFTLISRPNHFPTSQLQIRAFNRPNLYIFRHLTGYLICRTSSSTINFHLWLLLKRTRTKWARTENLKFLRPNKLISLSQRTQWQDQLIWLTISEMRSSWLHWLVIQDRCHPHTKTALREPHTTWWRCHHLLSSSNHRIWLYLTDLTLKGDPEANNREIGLKHLFESLYEIINKPIERGNLTFQIDDKDRLDFIEYILKWSNI